MDIGHWEFEHEFKPDEWFGFVYRIIDLDSNQEYLGKKQFFSKTRKNVKGRKNKKIVRKESNWKVYMSSSNHVKNAIEVKGKEKFKFLIESLHKTKGSLSYAEVKIQIFEDVLRSKLADNVTKKYYNKQIGAVRFIPPDEMLEEQKMKVK